MAEGQYLGDGVYVEMVEYRVGQHDTLRLTTGSHSLVEAANTIYLEDFVFDALVQYRDHALALQEDGDEG